MRPKHQQHPLTAFPVYSCSFLAPNQFVLGGGGGATKSGIKNKLRLYKLSDDLSIELQDEFELEKGEDAPMSMAVWPEDGGIVCGINSVLEKMEAGQNESCRVFSVVDAKLKFVSRRSTLPQGDLEDYQKITALSPDGKYLAVSGSHDLSLFYYPSLEPVAEPIHSDKEIYDASFSSTSLVIATTHNLLVYELPNSTSTSNAEEKNPSSPAAKKGKKKLTSTSNGHGEKTNALELQHTIDIPSVVEEGSTFRNAKFHPLDESLLYTVINTTSPRKKQARTASRHASICIWDTKSWSVTKSRKVGDRGLTCFDVSVDGLYLAYGSSDLSVGMLDSKTLSPVFTILKAHEFPPTVIKFNPTTTSIISGSADNSIRVVTVPAIAKDSSWTLFWLVFAIIIVLLAIAAQQLDGKYLW
ncbi:WD40-repeat-containing domain protein [Panaeolus papilionaceus]|nr:WD40-repeat-containing domain protein [Panaeolus papilionaceus]